MEKVKLGFVGAGFMGQVAHLIHYANMEECEVVALAEPRKKLAKKVANRYGIKRIYSNHKELINDEEIEAVVASQPFDRHIKIIPDILNKGLPVFTEKPLAVSVEAGEKLVELAEKNNVFHMVGYHKISDPALEYTKEKIKKWRESNQYGSMRYVRITMPPGDWIANGGDFHLSTDEDYPEGETETIPDYFDEETYKRYKSFINYYIHQVNALRNLFDESYQLKFVDNSEVLMVAESKSGICGTIEMAPYKTSRSWEESILVGFENAYIKVNLPAPLRRQKAGDVLIMKDKENDSSPFKVSPVLPKISAMKNQALNFIKAVKKEKSVPVDSRQALEDLKIAREYINLIK